MAIKGHWDMALGLPSEVVAALRKTRDARCRRSGFDSVSSGEDSPTLDYVGRVPCQLPLGSQLDLVHLFRGLTVKFILDFSRGLLRQSPTCFLDNQVKVVVLDSLFGLKNVACQAFEGGLSPTWIFVLCGHHWTLVHFSLEDTMLQVVQYDGLAHTAISKLAPLIRVIKSAWGA